MNIYKYMKWYKQNRTKKLNISPKQVLVNVWLYFLGLIHFEQLLVNVTIIFDIVFIWELIFIYCGLFVLILVVFFSFTTFRPNFTSGLLQVIYRDLE